MACSIRRTCRCCKRWVCPRRWVSYCAGLRIVLRPNVILVCALAFVCHATAVLYTIDLLGRGFFRLDPHKAAAKYYDTNEGNFMGNLLVLENQAPIDALYEFASSFGTYGEKHLNTPILRRPRYWNLFRQLCEENEHLDCSRRKPRDQILKGVSVTQWGFKHDVHYYRPDHPDDCVPEVQVDQKGPFNTTSCSMAAAVKFCDQLDPPPPGCPPMIARSVEEALKIYEDTLRWDGKNHYRAFEMTRDESNGTIRERIMELSRHYGLPCMKGPYGKEVFDKAWKKVNRLHSAMRMIDEPDERDFYDQPCRVVFGAMCARTKPSGDMLIEQLN